MTSTGQLWVRLAVAFNDWRARTGTGYEGWWRTRVADGGVGDNVAVVTHPSTMTGDRAAAPADTRVRPRPRYVWAWAAVWLVYLGQPISTAWHDPDPWRRWVTLATVIAFAGVFLTAFTQLPGLRTQAGRVPRHGVLLTAVGAALAILLVATLGLHALAVFVYVAVMAMFLLPRQWGPGVVVVLLGGTLVVQWVTPHWRTDYAIEFEIFVASMAMWGVGQIILRNRELAAAREEITRLAVADERNRFARDLHDILGHSLTVVAVKAELAGRLLRADPDRAAREIADVEGLSRQALAEVRTAVSGYREVTLGNELVNARSALFAAGIDAELPAAIDQVPSKYRELFGWVVREGITNVVRHSGASHCTVRIGPSEVEITDDGAAPASTKDGGHGLAGLRERAEAVGGSLSVRRRTEGGFALTVRV